MSIEIAKLWLPSNWFHRKPDDSKAPSIPNAASKFWLTFDWPLTDNWKYWAFSVCCGFHNLWMLDNGYFTIDTRHILGKKKNTLLAFQFKEPSCTLVIKVYATQSVIFSDLDVNTQTTISIDMPFDPNSPEIIWQKRSLVLLYAIYGSIQSSRSKNETSSIMSAFTSHGFSQRFKTLFLYRYQITKRFFSTKQGL